MNVMEDDDWTDKIRCGKHSDFGGVTEDLWDSGLFLLVYFFLFQQNPPLLWYS